MKSITRRGFFAFVPLLGVMLGPPPRSESAVDTQLRLMVKQLRAFNDEMNKSNKDFKMRLLAAELHRRVRDGKKQSLICWKHHKAIERRA